TESIVLYVVVAGLVFLNRFLSHRGLTRLDRFVLFLFLIEPVLGNLQVIFPEELLRSYFKYSMTSELAYHRYSYAVIEIAAMTGWFIEKMPLVLNGRLWKKMELWLMAATGLVLAGILLNPETGFFRYAPNVIPPYGMTNPKLLLMLLPFVFLTVWFFYRFPNVRRVMSDRRFVVAVIMAMTLSGYPLLAGQSYDPKTHFYNFRDYPFGGAYRWLNQNADKNDVVLTVPPSRLDFDYLIFYTDLKDYINPYGSRLAERHARNDNTFRFLFYFNLLLDDFRGFESEGVTRVEDKLKKLRINYVLMEMPSPFLPHVVEQLKGHFAPAYQDQKCLLLKVT
ncbi:MAG: hypothetical protein PHS88_09865, partial [Candidatus Omnitrophica bacterium]|nr:hypothetical protein [Candidatus Omnitrophota bacterium]